MKCWRALVLLAASLTSFAQTPHDAVPDLAIGKRVFESQCALCHGQDGSGGRGPSLRRPKLAKAPDTASLRKAISEGLPPEMPGAWQLSVREVASVAGYVESLGATVAAEQLPGDAARGAKLFAAKGCAGCHIVDGAGTAQGPDLSGVGARRNARHLRESLVNPAAYLPEGFLVMEVTVAATGAVIRGLKENEDPFTLQLVGLDGRRHSLRKAELRGEIRRRTGESTMPSFANSLAPAELDDLVAYLATRRETR